MGSFLQALAAVPQIINAIKELLSWMEKQQVASAKGAVDAGMEEANASGNQTKLEQAMGSTVAGKPSGLPGTEFRDDLPN